MGFVLPNPVMVLVAAATVQGSPQKCLLSPGAPPVERRLASTVQCPSDPKGWLQEVLPKPEPGSKEEPDPIDARRTYSTLLAEQYRACELPPGPSWYDLSPIGITLRRAQLKAMFSRELFMLQRMVGNSSLFPGELKTFKERWLRIPREDQDVLRLDRQAVGTEERCWLTARISPEDCPELQGKGAKNLLDSVAETNKDIHLTEQRKTGIPPSLTHDLLKAILALEIVRHDTMGKENIETVLTNVNRAPTAPLNRGYFQDLFYEYFPELLVSKDLQGQGLHLLQNMRNLPEFRRRFTLLNRSDEPYFEDRELIIQYMRYRATKDKSSLELLKGNELLGEMNHEWPVWRHKFLTIHQGLSKERTPNGKELKGIDSCAPDDASCLKARNQEQLRYIYFLFWQALKEHPLSQAELGRLEQTFGAARADWLRENDSLIIRAKKNPKWLRTRDNLVMVALEDSLNSEDYATAASMLRLLGSNYVDVVEEGVSRVRTQAIGGVAIAGITVVAIILAAPSGGSSLVLLGVTAGAAANALFLTSAAGGVALASKRYLDARKDYDRALTSFRLNHERSTSVLNLETRKADAGWGVVWTMPSVVVLGLAGRLSGVVQEEKALVTLSRARAGGLTPAEVARAASLKEQEEALRTLIKAISYTGGAHSGATGDWMGAVIQAAVGKLLAAGGPGFPGVNPALGAVGKIRYIGPVVRTLGRAVGFGVESEADTLFDEFLQLKIQSQ